MGDDQGSLERKEDVATSDKGKMKNSTSIILVLLSVTAGNILKFGFSPEVLILRSPHRVSNQCNSQNEIDKNLKFNIFFRGCEITLWSVGQIRLRLYLNVVGVSSKGLSI